MQHGDVSRMDTPNRRYGDAIAHSFGAQRAPAFTSRTLRAAQIGVTHLIVGPEKMGRTPIVPAEDSFIVAVYLNAMRRHELWSRGKCFLAQGYAAHSMRIVNLEAEFSAHVSEPHQSVYFYIPRAALNGFAEDEGLKRPGTLACEPGMLDPVMAGFVQALLSSFHAAHEPNALFIDHLTLTVCAHLMQRYGDYGHPPPLKSGGLSNTQEGRAKAYLSAHFAENISVASVAEACGLSRGHFTRAFRESIGTTPYKWLLHYRLDQAKARLSLGNTPIADIALTCGFSDQAQFTRAFTLSLIHISEPTRPY